MLPIPFENFIPKMLKDTATTDDRAIAFIAKINDLLEEWRDELIELYYLKSPERCPNKFLSELGYWLGANLLAFDTEAEKRIKIESAVRRNVNIGSWENDAKIIIDGIAGGDASIVTGYYTGDWIMWGKESTDFDDYTGTLGIDGIDDDLGLDLFGAFDECGIAGVIWIDVDNDSLTSDEVDKIVLNLDDTIVPAYFRVLLGYIDGVTGFFEVYETIG